MTGLDPGFWVPVLRDQFVRSIRAFERAAIDRVLPAFSGLEAEAEAITNAEYERLGRLPANDARDMADAAEQAQDAGLAHYEEATDTRQALLNLFAAALFHLVEQQLLFFHRRQVLRPREENDIALFGRKTMQVRLAEAGVDLDEISHRTGLTELELVANVVKHGDGRSAETLREMKSVVLVPELFRDESGRLGQPVGRIVAPLAGDGIYVSSDDLQRYANIAVRFWEEMAEAVGAAR